MILRVRDLDSIFAKLQKFGATVMTAAGKPVTINNTVHVVFVQDPDGFVVELGQGTPPAGSKSRSAMCSAEHLNCRS